MGKLMIYGATGYTGTLITQHAKATGMHAVLAGRSGEKLLSLAATLDFPYQHFDLTDPSTIDANLADISVLLNCAGPFAATAEPLIKACIRNGVHYLDTSAELDTYTLAAQSDLEAQASKTMILPGCGGSVALFGCLVSRALENIPLTDVQSVDLALHVSGSMSRGSAITAAAGSASPTLQRHGGKLVTHEPSATTQLDFNDGRGPVPCFPVTLPDLITIHKFFNIENIRTFANVSGTAFPDGDLYDLPDGPAAEERERSPYHAVVVVTLKDGTVERTSVRTVNGYDLVARASVEAVRRVMGGEVLMGFQTSAKVFGEGFILGGASRLVR